MSQFEATLCYPDGLKSCFACCPPIRPAGYDHSDFKGMIQRVLRENTRSFDSRLKEVRPITGYSCWALGYLDPRCRLVGCLLHPACHDGADLRYRVDYGDKCRREKCPQAVEFEKLSPEAKSALISMTRDQDSFAYSSPKTNPLFCLLDWGAEAMERVACRSGETIGGPRDLIKRFPFFGTSVAPKAYAYFLDILLTRSGLEPLKKKSFLVGFEGFAIMAAQQATSAIEPADRQALFTHRLPLDRRFLDFVRLAGGATRIRLQKAEEIKRSMDAAFEDFLASEVCR